MSKKILFIFLLSITSQLINAQGISLDQLNELRPKSISKLNEALVIKNYEIESTIKKDFATQIVYKSKIKTNKESITIHYYKGRDNFISYFYKSSKIELNLINQIKQKDATLIKEDVTTDGNVLYVYKTKNLVYFIVKNKEISSITIYTNKDYFLYYDAK